MPVSLPPADLPRAAAPAPGAPRGAAAADKPAETSANFDAELDAAAHDAAPQAAVKAIEAPPPSADASIKPPVVSLEALVAVEAAAPALAPILDLAAAAKPTAETVPPPPSAELAIKADGAAPVATQPSAPAANNPDAPPAPPIPVALSQNELAANAVVTAAIAAALPTDQADEKPAGEKVEDVDADIAITDNGEPSQTAATVAPQNNIALMAAAVAPAAAQTVAPDAAAAEQAPNKDASIAAIAAGEPLTRTAEPIVAGAASAPQKLASPTVADAPLHDGGANPEAEQRSPETVEPQTANDEPAKASKPGDAAALDKLVARPRETLIDNLPQPSEMNRHGAGIHAPQPTLSLSDVATPAAAQQAQNAPQQQAIPIHMAPLAIGMQALEGAREFQIRLDPDELGRVDVKLTISEDGRVAAALVVDRVETMAMLQRDARTLERAFDQAGLTADSDSISFSLRQDGSGDQQDARRESATPSQSNIRNIAIDVAADIAPARGWRAGAAASGVDIRV